MNIQKSRRVQSTWKAPWTNSTSLRFIQFSHNSRIQILFKFPQSISQKTLDHIQGHKTRWKISWSKGIEIIESVLLSLWNYDRDQYQRIFENNPQIFKRNVTFTKRELWLSHAIESFNKVRRLKQRRGWLQKRKHLNEKLISKWEINIKDTLKLPCIWKLNVHF